MFRVFDCLLCLKRLIEGPGSLQRQQQPANFIINLLNIELAILNRLEDMLLRHPSGRTGHFEVKTIGDYLRGIGAVPI